MKYQAKVTAIKLALDELESIRHVWSGEADGLADRVVEAAKAWVFDQTEDTRRLTERLTLEISKVALDKLIEATAMSVVILIGTAVAEKSPEKVIEYSQDVINGVAHIKTLLEPKNKRGLK